MLGGGHNTIAVCCRGCEGPWGGSFPEGSRLACVGEKGPECLGHGSKHSAVSDKREAIKAKRPASLSPSVKQTWVQVLTLPFYWL